MISAKSGRVILRALENYRGDNFARAKAAWGHLSDEELDKEHGESGQTRREILAGYQVHVEAVDKAIVELKRYSN